MTKNEQIRKLFTENREALVAADITTPVRKNAICFDGIIDEEVFESLDTKVIFLLKEPNGNSAIKNEDGTISTRLPEVMPEWDYRKWLQEQQAYGYNSDDDPDSNKFYSTAFNKLCMWLDIFYDCIKGVDVSHQEYCKERYNTAHFRDLLKRTGIPK